jgi:hypothetical protein
VRGGGGSLGFMAESRGGGESPGEPLNTDVHVALDLPDATQSE